MLNLVSLSTQSLASCVNYFWNCFKCFSKHIKVPYKFFDIVQFSRSCAPQPFGWRPVYFTTEVVFCQVFFRSFWTFWTWIVQEFLGTNRNIWTLIGSFQGLRAELEEVVLFAQRLALKYNTTPRDSCQHFLTSFFQFLCRAKIPLFFPIIITAFSWQGSRQNVLWSHSSILYDIAILII